ncbi:MAG: hypothetical protein ABI678_02495 [Kofleriaceae bacterium]
MLRLATIAFTFASIASATPASANTYFVSPSGHDDWPGTIAQPFRTFAQGVSVLASGDVLDLRGGVYVGQFDVALKSGITIQSHPNETAYLDGTLAAFRAPNPADWVPAHASDPTAPADEYISTTLVTDFIRGAFLDRNPYTRLVTYSDLRDLRATNETFAKIINPAADARCGQSGSNAPRCEDVVAECKAPFDPTCTIVDGVRRFRPAGYAYPHFYMGPGIWVDPTVSASNPKPIHIRLAPTHNNIPGLADYAGFTDPRQVKLAITQKNAIALSIRSTTNVTIKDLTVRFGGEDTMMATNNTALTLSNVRVFAGSVAMRSNSNTGLKLTQSSFDGGLPTWMFRSDKKDEYDYVSAGVVSHNNLGGQSVIGLLRPGSADSGWEISNCDLFNSHDMYVSISGLQMHDNWIANLNDEALILDDVAVSNVNIYRNVITQTLNPISFAGAEVGGRISIYRNLVDLRAPTAGYRPQFVGDTAVWRYGSLVKSNTSETKAYDGPYDLFQNTFLVYDQRGAQALFEHYRDGGIAPGGTNRRRSFNNVFYAVNPSPDPVYDAITFVPSPSFPAETDGNSYFRRGNATQKEFRYFPFPCATGTCPGGYAADLTELRSLPIFMASKTQYAPGYENSSIETDPQFVRIGADGKPRSTDDLRLSVTSPARNAGVPLAEPLRSLDPLAPPAGSRPDIGVYPFGGPSLAVGVGGLRHYPQ